MIVGFVISIARNDICRVKFPVVITTITILLSVNNPISVRGFFRSITIFISVQGYCKYSIDEFVSFITSLSYMIKFYCLH